MKITMICLHSALFKLALSQFSPFPLRRLMHEISIFQVATGKGSLSFYPFELNTINIDAPQMHNLFLCSHSGKKRPFQPLHPYGN